MQLMRNAKFFLFVLLVAALASAARAADPVLPIITNLVAVQRPGTFFVDVTYDLIDPDSWAVFISVEFSTNGGASYLPTVYSTTGDMGLVAPGLGKRIVWNAWNDWAGNYTTNAKVRMIVDDTVSVSPPPTNAPPTNMVWIPNGSFNMSGTMVYLPRGFYMAKCETAQTEYTALMTNNPSNFIGPTLPVDSVTWYEAVNYCALLTARERSAGRLPTGWVYRLPTEAEWEYACRAGTTTTYSFGGTTVNMDLYAWYSGNAQSTTHVVGRKRANHWGLYDMHGNVSEWCQDWYGELPGGNVTDPQGPSSGSNRVIRGGSWDRDASGCTSAARDNRGPSDRGYRGFRVVLAPVQ
jgi:formylglycine-generating enzyme required for sulfatase activity